MTTSFTYSCFIIWKTMKDTWKECVVVDIRALNKIMMSDTYSVSLQTDILVTIQEAKYISTVDYISFFYQWWVKPEHDHCLTVASHREQETFKVAVMNYWNSSAYIQQMIDWLLCPHCDFTHVYVNDIVIFFSFLNEHIHHLHKIFDTLLKWDICLSLQKSFLVYSSVNLLNQWVDALDLTTAEEKLAAIQNLKFSMTLSQLKHYLRLTGYLCQYVSWYAAIVKLLQIWKMSLNQDLHKKSIRDNAHKRAADKTEVLKLTLSELSSFHLLQWLFAESTILSHFSSKQQLYVDLNASKEWGFSAHIYHIKKDTDILIKTTSESKSMKSILFLSWLLINVKTRYWSTELKVAGLVWVVKKIRHMIEAAELFIIVYTDHSAAIFIIC